MEQRRFSKEALTEENPRWKHAISRCHPIYQKKYDIRSDFSRDYNRILHSKAYRRLKHKTQVFYATANDHVCTRIEHVNHVASVSYSIANFLGLNTELTSAIALGHDLGHAPFGHVGEQILSDIADKEFGEKFWHEKNSLFFIDHIETLPDLKGKEKNLNLTYAVRDGIISHCGEVNENAIFPRKNYIDLETIHRPNQYAPYSWEGCIVKIADKISYLGRDIEDAITLRMLTRDQLSELRSLAEKIKKVPVEQINNTVLMHDFINNICKMSSPENGIRFSDKFLQLINSIKAFNYKHIYNHKRMKVYREYSNLVINSIYHTLADLSSVTDIMGELRMAEVHYPNLAGAYRYWLTKYSDIDNEQRPQTKFRNQIIYRTEQTLHRKKAIIHFIASMTDQFAIKLFGELTRF